MKPISRLRAVGLLAFTVSNPAPAAQLYWGGATVGEWNTTASNWVAMPYDTNFTVFRPGDSTAAWYVALFIGREGVPLSVTPSNASFSGQTLVHGGDITGPSRVIIVDEESDVIFSNYAGGLSFTGGTLLTDEGTLIIDAGAMPQDAVFWFGQGPMVFDEGMLRIRSTSPSRSFTLANQLDIEEGSGFDFSSCAGPAALGGLVRLFSLANINTGGEPGEPPVRITGTIQVGEAGGFSPALWRSFGSGRDLVVEGNLVNEPTPLSDPVPPLELINFDRGTIRFTGVNTFTQGCTIVGHPLVRVDPSGMDYAIEVAAGSSLGSGDVRVGTNALLRLLGAGAVHASARLTVQGSVHVAANIMVICRDLTLGEQVHTSGTFDQDNSAGHIVGPGSIQVQCDPGGASSPPRLTLRRTEAPAPPGIVLSFTTAPCQSYQIEVTASLAHPEWDAVATIDASAEPRPVTVSIPPHPFIRRLFFRAVSSSAH